MGGIAFGGFTPLEWETHEWNGMHGEGRNCSK
jgi:hypothetical protein